MKKYILALLVLLLLLILTCLYEKTSLLHAKYSDNNATFVKPSHNTLAPSKKSIQKTMPETATEKIRKEAIKTIIMKTKQETKVPTAQKVEKLVPTKSLPLLKKDIKEIDTLMRALKERKTAFKNREAYELYIQQLITRALANRSATIAHMNKEELYLLELQNELLKNRDIAYHKIGQTNTPKSGE